MTRAEMLSKKVFYRVFFRLFKRSYGTLNVDKLFTLIRIEMQSSLKRDSKKRLVAPDDIRIRIPVQAFSQEVDLEAMARDLEERVADFAQSQGFLLPVDPSIHISAVTSVKGNEVEFDCTHTPPEYQPTMYMRRLLVTWEGGEKRIKFHEGSFYLGNNKKCEQRINVPGLKECIASVMVEDGKLYIAPVSARYPASSQGVPFDELNQYLEVVKDVEIDFGGVVTVKVES